MSTKEKLDLLWKYLALIVIAILGLRFTENINSEYISNNDDIVVFGDNVPTLNDNNLNVEVKKEIIDGDTVMNVMVNGKELDSLEFNQSFDDVVSWKSKDGKKRILKMKKTIRINDTDVDLETDIDEVIKKYINKPSKD
jgi:hypothetical protein|tara:strand:+ start:677 stop:1093 length:417 start_codon:yes stop_codon:yes gene_type:complete